METDASEATAVSFPMIASLLQITRSVRLLSVSREDTKRTKAQVDVHFNWIFVLIIGAVILTFFLFVISRQKAVSDQRLAADVLADMELILTGQGISVGREDTVAIPELPLQFTCDDYGMLTMTRRIGNAVLFAPSSVESERLLTWTQEWDIPFKVSNLVYLTSPDIRYYLIYDPADDMATQFAKELNSSLPERMNKRMKSIREAITITDEGDDRVRLVYIFPAEERLTLPAGLRNLNDKAVSALAIRKDLAGADAYRGGASLGFYKKRGDQLEQDTIATPRGDRVGVYPSLGKGPLYGAVFADDFGLYECSMRKAIRRMKLIAMIHNQRANTLLTLASPRCVTYYSIAPFTSFALLNPDDLTNRIRAPGAVSELFSTAEILENLNRNTIRASCTTLY